jgi:hypothetical protein
MTISHDHPILQNLTDTTVLDGGGYMCDDDSPEVHQCFSELKEADRSSLWSLRKLQFSPSRTPGRRQLRTADPVLKPRHYREQYQLAAWTVRLHGEYLSITLHEGIGRGRAKGEASARRRGDLKMRCQCQPANAMPRTVQSQIGACTPRSPERGEP